MNSFYNDKELEKFNFKSYGENVKISRKASLYFPEKISIGNNVRIDDFCILSGNVVLGNNVHISAYTALYGGGEIIIGDYSGCSPRCTLLSSSDDFSGEYMVGAVIDEKYTNVTKGKIILKNFVQLGANTIILPNVTIGEGTVTGCMSFVNKNLDDWNIYTGIPASLLKKRNKKLLNMVNEYEKR